MARRFRIRGGVFPTILSIMLVLYLLGAFGLFLLHAIEIKREIKQSVDLNVIYNELTPLNEMKRMQAWLQNRPYVRSAEYISKDAALAMMQKELGEGTEEILGYNPFPPTIQVYFREEFVTTDSLDHLIGLLGTKEGVAEVSYKRSVVEGLDRNLRTITLLLLGLAAVLAVVSVLLVNNTVRLMLYSRRMTIRSMQLVGATDGFIAAPFVRSGMGMGLIGAMIALFLLGITLYMVNRNFPIIQSLQSLPKISLLFGALLVFGAVMPMLSSALTLRRYLHTPAEKLWR